MVVAMEGFEFLTHISMVVSFSLDMVQIVRNICEHRGGEPLGLYIRAADLRQLEAFNG